MNTSNWDAGYVSDIDYTYGYYRELNPLRIQLAFLNNGLVYPENGTACELGFGQGLSTNIHAAASVTSWFGNDFSPSQASFGQELAGASEADVKLCDDSFEEFLKRTDLPDFDYIGLHGIWSWISDTNRALIVEFIKRKLKVGGVVYVSYNTLPGWSTFAPMRHLMNEHSRILGSEGQGIVNRINGAIEFTSNLLDTNTIFAKVNPTTEDRLKNFNEQDRHYLAHEYFNKDWHPMYFSTMSEWLKPAKVQFACSAHYLDQIDAINLTLDQKTFLDSIPDLGLRQSSLDFITNQSFRRDYWVKGARKLSPIEQHEKISALRVIQINSRDKITLSTTASLRTIELNEEIYDPILDLLSSYRPRAIREIASSLKPKGIEFNHVLEAIVVLSGMGHVAMVQSETIIAKSHKHTALLNSHILKKARDSGVIDYLASPVIGGGVFVGRFQQLFVSAIMLGHKSHQEWAQFAWNTLNVLGEKLVLDGKLLELESDNIKELQSQAKEFERLRLPILKALLIV